MPTFQNLFYEITIKDVKLTIQIIGDNCTITFKKQLGWRKSGLVNKLKKLFHAGGYWFKNSCDKFDKINFI